MTKKISIIILTCLVLSLALPTLMQAQTIPELKNQNDAFLKKAGLGTKSIGVIISNIIKVFLSFLGVIFIILIIYAGFNWMTSAGNEEKISRAKTTMTAAVVGLAIVLSAYTITYFVIDAILESTKGGQGLD